MRATKKRIDLKRLRKDLSRLTDVNYLKKEFNRITGELRKVDLQRHLTPQAKKAFDSLETRFQELLLSLAEIQKQIDSNLSSLQKDSRLQKVVNLVRRPSGTSITKRAGSKKTSGKSSGAKKTSTKKATGSKKTSSRKKA